MIIFNSLDLSLPDHCVFWAACTLAYFGFLRLAEFMVPKIDPFCKGCFIHTGKDSFPLCALQAVMAYLVVGGNSGGPLFFLFQDGRPLSRALLTAWLR